MSGWNDMERADDLIVGLMSMDLGRAESRGFSVVNSVAGVGVRSIHYLVGVNQLIRNSPEMKKHLFMFPGGFLAQALEETIRVLTEEVGGYRRDDLIIQYGMHEIE